MSSNKDNKTTPKKVAPLPVWKNILCGSVAACIAEVYTIPLDTAKVRLQVQGQQMSKLGAEYVPKYNNLTHAVKTIFAEEGVRALWKGIFAGLQRQFVFAGIRIGTYPKIRDTIAGEMKEGETPKFGYRVLAALITGAVGITVACPTDVVKIRLQAEGRLPEGTPKKYNGSVDAYSKIIKQEGIGNLWKGLTPNIFRNSIMNAAELASYDQIKSTILKMRPSINPDSKLLHITCGLCAGFIAVCLASPMDVVKTRIMNSPTEYSGMLNCFTKIASVEGIGAFYGGFNANFARVATWNVIMFMSLEQCVIYARGTGKH